MQVTAQSLLGRWGEPVQKHAEEWLEQGMVHFIASDAHHVKHRPLQLRKAYDAVSARFGEPRAQALFVDNPLAAFEGRPLVYEPEQPDIAAQPEHSRRKKRFIFF